MTGNDDRFNFRLLKQHVTIGHVLSVYGLASSLRARGDQLCGPCPLHGGDSPTAFRVQLSRGIWRCFTACGGGDIVDLVRRIENCDHAQAARRLYQLAQNEQTLPPPQSPPSSPRAMTTSFRPFRRCLPLNPRVPFLQRGKGITVPTASRFEAGCTDRSHFLRDTVAVRLHDLNGKPLGYCGRRLSSAEISRWGKWRFPADFPKSNSLYNAHRAAHARTGGIVLVECPWAVMRLAQAGVVGAVALLGTSLSDAQTSWLAAARRVLLLLDGDNAGRNAAANIAKRLAGDTVVHELPEGQEPEDLSDHQLATLVHTRLPSSLNQYFLHRSRRDAP